MTKQPPATRDVRTVRARAIAFITANGGQADRSAIKEHLGLDPLAYWPCFDQAMRTAKLVPVYGDGVIGRTADGAPLVLSRKPVVAYCLA